MKAYTFPILMAEVIFRISSHSQVSKEETEHFFKINFKKLLTLFKNFVILYMKFDIFLYI